MSQEELRSLIKEKSEVVNLLFSQVEKKVVGQKALLRRLLQGLLCNGHVLLEGVPGLAKTLSIKTLAECLDGSFHRIQFTPDLLPADIIGTEVFQPKTGEFYIRQGPVFANFILADEINRAPAKVQSALLETMQERQVTIGGQTLKLPSPFFVLATQNPIEQEGTYPLPEAQVDRFLMKVTVTYPKPEDEKRILDLDSIKNPEQQSTSQEDRFRISLGEITELSKLCSSIYVDEKIKDYIVTLVNNTRHPESSQSKNVKQFIELGASPRASISLYQMARTEAFLSGSYFVVPQHIKNVAHDVLRHRILLSFEAQAQGVTVDEVISSILDSTPVP